MDTLGNIIEAIQDDLHVDDNSTLYPRARITRAANRGYRKSAALFPWPETEDAKKTVTQANVENYDYPKTWKSDSIWKITITNSAGTEERYGEDPDGSPLSFDDYLVWKEENPDATDKKWANQKRRFFITPKPTALGSIATGIGVISVWGHVVPTALSDDSDTTVFSFSTPEVNEAIVLEAIAILKSDDDKSAEFRSAEAKQILVSAWNAVKKENSKYEKNQGMFDVPDFFGRGNSKDLRGKFDI